MTLTPHWGRLPEDLRQRKQWLVAGPDDQGLNKAPYSWFNGSLHRVGNNDPRAWLNFETACELAYARGLGVGYCIAAGDPFACIDMDVKNKFNAPNKPELWSTPSQIDRMWKVTTAFNTYTERSQSGQGLHAWIRATIGTGAKHDGIEIYSQSRFIVCTGDIVTDRPIMEHQVLAERLYLEIRAQQGAIHARVSLQELYEEESDYDIWERAESADNGAKFKQLVAGEWEGMGYPSQSEADLALLSIFTFYSRSNEQCRRLFRATKLGKRAKASKDDRYLDFTLQLIRARQADEDASIARVNLDSAVVFAQAQLQELMGRLGVQPGGMGSSGPDGSSLAVETVHGHRSNGSSAQQSGSPFTHIEPKGSSFGGSGQTATAEAIRNYAASLGPANTAAGIPAGAASATGQQTHGAGLPDTATSNLLLGLTPAPSLSPGDKGLDWPPGFVGALAGFIYRSAPRPVREVAIVAALGWLAGVCGKSWNIPGSGLNMYIILVALSGVGKEAMHSGIGALLAKLREGFPGAQDFVDFSEFASGPALVKGCSKNPCFVNVAGEWGKKLRGMAVDDIGTGPLATLRTAMTNLYQKSGPQSIVGGITYSNKDNNVVSVTGVAYSMIGETTPETFYDSLTTSMMEDGFMSRFVIIEHTGMRPPANPCMQLVPEPALVEHCMRIMVQSKQMLGNYAPPIGVRRDDQAAVVIDAFDLECDAEINKSMDSSWRQMWSRAHLKMMRIAAILAVGDNPYQPVINMTHVSWALSVIRRDIAIMRRKVETGEIGSGDGARERRLIGLIREYMSKEPAPGYNIPSKMRQNGIIPSSYLHNRSSKLSIFTNSKTGATRAFNDSMRSLEDSGYLSIVEKVQINKDYGAAGKCYRIGSLPTFENT